MGKRRKKRPAQAHREGVALRRGIGLARFLVPGLVLVVVVMVGALSALGWLQFGRHQELSEQRLAELLADQKVALVNQRIDTVTALVEQLTRNPQLAAVARQEAVEVLEARLSAWLPSLNVTLMGPDEVLVEDDLSFSAQDAIRRAQSTDGIILAVSARPRIMLFAAKRAEAGAVLMVGMPLDELRHSLGRHNIDGASVKLLLDGQTPLFVRGEPERTGRQARRDAAAGLSVAVTEPVGASDPALQVLFGTIGGGAVALVVLLWVSTLLAMGRGLRKDGALLTHLAEDLAVKPDARPRSAFTYPVLERAGEAVARVMRRRAAPQASSPLGDVVPEDITLLLDDDVAGGASGSSAGALTLPAEIFREYDIRGNAERELTPEAVRRLGQAIGTEALEAGQKTVLVARDGRLSSPDLARAVIEGITASGADAVDIGMVPTPVLSWATSTLDTRSGVCVTGSHNPPGENGLKITIAGTALHGDRIQSLRARVERGLFKSGKGRVTEIDVLTRYADEVVASVRMERPLRVAVDCGNGVAGVVAPGILRRLGCRVTKLFTDVDGNFPNHVPDTSEPAAYDAMLRELADGNADIGIMFDGDGDRIGVAVPGEIIWADRLMMLFARDLLAQQPGAEVICDVKCSRHLMRLIEELGGRPVMCRTGHSLVRGKLAEDKAPLAGEMSGHIFFADRWHGVDDGVYAAARLLEVLARTDQSPAEVFAGLRTGIATPEIRIPVKEAAKFPLVEQLRRHAAEFGGTPNTLDGLRVDFEDGWGLVRASNTGALLTARFEGDDEQALERIQAVFREHLLAINPQLQLSF